MALPPPGGGTAPPTPPATYNSADQANTDTSGSGIVTSSGSKGSPYGFDDGWQKGNVTTGALFSSLIGGSAPPDKVMQAFTTAPAGVQAQIQQYLLLAGYYPKDYVPTFGVLRSQDVAAFKEIVQVSMETGGDLSAYLESAAAQGSLTGLGGGGTPKQPAVHETSLTNPADISAVFQNAMQKTLGRRGNPTETSTFVSFFQGEEARYQQQKFAAEDQATAQANAAMAPTPTNSVNFALGPGDPRADTTPQVSLSARASRAGSWEPGMGAQQPSPPTNQPLTVQQAIALASNAGFRGQGLAVAVAVAMAESSLKADNTSGNSDGSVDRGLWQINSKWHPEVSDAQAFDPVANANAAFRISNGGTDFSPWTTFKQGQFTKYLPMVQIALGQPVDMSNLPEAGKPKIPPPINLTATQAPNLLYGAEEQIRAQHPDEAHAHDEAGAYSTFVKLLGGPGGISAPGVSVSA